MNILITGASGFLGSHVIDALLKQNHMISACVHENSVHPSVRSINIDFVTMQTATDWIPHLINTDVAINCVGIIAETSRQSFDVMHRISAIALFKACQQSGVKRVIQISALGADETASVVFLRKKGQADGFLSACTALEWFILRSFLIYGKDGLSFKLFQFMSNLWIIPLINKGHQMIQSVHINSVVKTIEKCLKTTQTNQTIAVVGKQPISFKNWLLKL